MKRNIYTVTKVNTYIKNMFEQDFLLKKIQIKGEVSNCKYHSSGHIYFTLKDDTSVLAAVMYKSYRGKGLHFPMKDGDNVVVFGSVSVYQNRGQYQVYVQEVQLDGEGAIFQKYEKLKNELQEMGMFDACYKQPIPKYIKKLGVVTSRTGAVIQDIRNVSERRNPYIQIILYSAHVQGERAAEELVNGIRALEQYGVDTIIIGRGGGSVEDLWVFNELIVAQAIFQSRIPVISAVGHQTNDTIADLVADLRAPTPSAAAELAVFDYGQFQELMRTMKAALMLRMQEHLTRESQRLEHLQMKLRYLSPGFKMELQKKRLMELQDKLHARMAYCMDDYHHKLQFMAQQLEAGSPVKKLSQGYSYVTNSDNIPLKSTTQVQLGEELVIRTLDGRIHTKVTEIEDSYYEIASDMGVVK